MTAYEEKIYEQYLSLFDYDDLPYPEHDRMRYGAMRVHVYHSDAANFSILYEMLMFSGEDHRILQFHGFNNFGFLYACKDGKVQKSGWRDDFPQTIVRPDGVASVSSVVGAEDYVEERLKRQALNPEATVVSVRGKSVEIPHDAESYAKQQIETESPIQLISVLRYLIATERDLVFSTSEERQEFVGTQRAVLQLDDWCHLNMNEDFDEFYESESVRMLTKVAITGDPSHYAPTMEPNTHWSQR